MVVMITNYHVNITIFMETKLAYENSMPIIDYFLNQGSLLGIKYNRANFNRIGHLL